MTECSRPSPKSAMKVVINRVMRYKSIQKKLLIMKEEYIFKKLINILIFVYQVNQIIEVMDENKRIYKDDIEMNSDGLFYDDIENILKIQKYIQMETFQSEH